MTRKKILRTTVAAILAATVCTGQVWAELFPTEDYTGYNAGANDYRYYYRDNDYDFTDHFNWANPVRSYLTETEDGFMRFQTSRGESDYLVEYYSSDYKFLESQIIAAELPLFGAFYATENNYYILTGRENPEQSAEVECYRITKYDKDWNRLDSVGMFDCNTTVPFDAGTARMADDGQYLFIRTCHEMYRSDDGLNHQANVTVVIDMETMEIDYSGYLVSWDSVGYTSHSFNQFAKTDSDGTFVAVDHGDAYPRQVVLYVCGKYNNSYTHVNGINMFSITGETGENYTGVQVGGFEISDTAYIIAGSSVVQDEDYESRKTNNIFVSALRKDSDEPVITWITNYKEGDGILSNPHLTKLDDNRFLLIWSKDDTVYYTELDGSGKQTSQVYSFKGQLSDCEPVVINGEAVWYVWKNITENWYDRVQGQWKAPGKSLVYYTVNADDISIHDIHEFNSVLGDVNGNGVIDDIDVIDLSRYLAGWDVDIDMDAANVNGDNVVDDLDVIMLARRLAGWNV